MVRRFPLTAIAAGVLQALGGAHAQAREGGLPVPCVAGSCGPQVTGFRQSGQATATVTGNTLNVNQTTDRAILNWRSFDVDADGRVVFNQPNGSSIALNRIYQESPSRIFGAVEANGQIYLINQNGIVFGSSARVKTAGLVASTLNISDEVFATGIVAPELASNRRPALESDGRLFVRYADGRTVPGEDGKPIEIKLIVENGAQIATAGSGGRVLLASRTVENGGRIETPDGQTLIAAGEKVYLQPNSDATLRGLLVEVDTGGTAWNRLTGDISAARGNVTIAGLAVNQDGRISATTTVSANGSIRLLGRDTVTLTQVNGRPSLDATHGGTVAFGAGSSTTVLPELTDKNTAVDEQAQDPSRVEANGQRISMGSGARIVAPGGEVSFVARRNPSAQIGDDAGSRIRIARDAVIDVSGSTASAAVERNLVTVELRANELRDAPLQRDGVLRGRAVVVDARVGTPLGDVSGALANLPRDVAERTSAGGTVLMRSEGDVAIDAGALINVSGGVINYRSGLIQTTQLISATGQIVDIGRADPNVEYVGLVNPTLTRSFDRWGVKETLNGPRIGRYDPGYVEGRAAGTVRIEAPAMLLNGTFEGHTTRGLYQRDLATVPAGGRFVLGVTGGEGGSGLLDFRAPSITLVSGLSNIVLGGDAPLPRNVPLELSVDFLNRGGFTRTELNSNGTVSLAAETPLHQGPGSSFAVRAREVDIRSDIFSIGGKIELAADVTTPIAGGVVTDPALRIASGVTLDVSGNWQNDLLDPQGASFLGGGSIDLAARSFDGRPTSLKLGDGVRLLANGGGRLQANGTVTGGAGGGIALRAPLFNSGLDLGKQVALEAFGVQGARGGALTLEARRVQITDGPEWAAPQAFDPALPDEPLQLGSALFSQFGFNTINITTTGPALSAEDTATLSIAPGTQIDARARTRELTGNLGERPSASSTFDFTRTVLLPEFQLAASAVTLRADPRDFINGGIGSISLGENSLVTGAARSSFNFISPGGIDFGGQVYALGGTIRASVPVPAQNFDTGFDPDLRIDVRAGATLDVSGGSLLRPSDAGLRSGEVLGGGVIELAADRGSVFIHGGSTINVSGSSAELDLRSGSAAGAYQRQTVASAGGTLTVRAPESLLLAGDLRGSAGAGGALQPAAGSLDISLSRSRGFGPGTPDLASSYPGNPRELRVIPDAFAGTPPNGVAVLEAARLRAGGFDALRLDTDGVLRLDAGLDLELARSLRLDTAVLDVAPGSSVRLAAPYIALGSTRALAAAPVATEGGGELHVQGALVDLVGDLALTRTGDVRIDSSGDLRLRGTVSGNALRGTLYAMGALTLSAERIYPTTFSEFRVEVDPAGDGSLHIRQNGSSAAVPLSAGGSMTFAAHDIEQAGTLLAPFGEISFVATGRVTLAAGSVTSVSAGNALIPLGRVELDNWFYTPGTTPLRQEAIPARRIEIDAPDIDIAANASIDLRGGGDLYASHWLPGTGGSRDVLDVASSNGYYAVLPELMNGFAPFDPQEFAGSALHPGDSVYLSGGAGLAAGVYPLLPAHYALLPGAYLVRAVAGFTDLVPAGATRLPDGTPVVAGYRTFADTGRGDARTSGFSILTPSQVRTLASYEDFKASTFFAARAARLGGSTPTLPADAGYLGLFAGESLNAHGNVLSAAASGGRGASIDVAANLLEIGGVSTAGDPDAVHIDAATLNGWNAASLLLGGRRSADGARVDAIAQRVSLADDTQLRGAEIVLAANENITLGENASLESGAARSELTPRTIALHSASGNAAPAVLAVSSTDRFDFTRSPAAQFAPGGSISLAPRSRVAAGGSLLIDAPAGATLGGTFDVGGADVAIATRDLLFSSESDAGGPAISADVLAGLTRAAALRFAGSHSIEFDGAVEIGTAAAPLASILFNSPVIGARDDDSSLAVFARSLAFLGGEAGVPGAGGSAVARFDADRIELLGGTLDFDGLQSVSLSARDGILAADDATLRAPAALDLNAGWLGTRTGAEVTVSAGGDMTVRRMATTAAPSGIGIGGLLQFDALNLDFGGNVLLPSGSLRLAATNNLRLRDGAVVDVSGVPVVSAGRSVDAPAGRIALEAGTDLRTDAGSVLRLDGARAAAAGVLAVRSGGSTTLSGDLSARSTSGAGGEILIDANQLLAFATLAARMEAGGFAARRDIRTRQGDLEIPTGAEWNVRHVALIADNGRIDITGTINANSGNERGSIEASAGLGLGLHDGARLRAIGASGLGRGGDIVLSTLDGTLDLAPGALLDVSGASEAGSVLLRARALDTRDVAIERIASTIRGASAVTVEPTLRFDDVQEIFNGARLTAYLNTANTFFSAALPTIQARLALPGGPELRVQPGIDLRRTGDLQISALDFRNWRFNGEPAAFTFRATGSINVNGTLSDGFVPNAFGGSPRFDLQNSRSATLRLVAGADLDGANITGTIGADADLSINNAFVRTGTGDITLAAARDIVFTGDNAGVYTGGLPGAATMNVSSGPLVVFPTSGGNVSLRAGHDVTGNPIETSVTNWQPRAGVAGDSFAPTRLGVDVFGFRFNTGTLGGGDLSIRAGHDVTNITAAAADSFHGDAGGLKHLAGGVLSIDASHDVGSPFVHVTAGENTINAGNALSRTRFGNSGEELGALFSMEAAGMNVNARAGIALESIFNPTMLVQVDAAPELNSFFFTYGERATFSATAVAGNVEMTPEFSRVGAFLGNQNALANDDTSVLQIFPSTFGLFALSGDVNLSGDPWMFPSLEGTLELFAGQDITTLGGLSMSDTALTALPTAQRPSDTLVALAEIKRGSQALNHLGDLEPAQVHAGRDILGGTLSTAKFANIAANRDILDFSLLAQNLRDTDATRIVAGRDIRLVSIGSSFEVAGPGDLDVLAVRDIDLGFSKGISTSGRLKNGVLPPLGANITAIAGFGQPLGVEKFVDGVIKPVSEYANLLQAYVRRVSGEATLDLDSAIAQFRLMDPQVQRPLLIDVFFRELVFAGREANRDPASNFARGYAAIDAMFPGSRDRDPKGTEGFVNPYAGDLSLAFSRIYTLSGGDINLLVPGGIVDVGMATPPAVGAPRRDPSDLGIVAQRSGSVRIYSAGDVLVNQSRVFTLGGGNIAIWSTLGDIDAGRGAKSAISAPAPQILVDGSGNVVIDLAGAVAGSGIRGILTDPTVEPGDVDLIAPAGIVNAGDAGIGAAGNLNVAAQQVVGLDNIQVGGSSTGVPAETSNLGASLSGVSASSSGASSSATKDAASNSGPAQRAALADTALGWLDVFLEGFGEEVCKANDTECLDRNRK